MKHYAAGFFLILSFFFHGQTGEKSVADESPRCGPSLDEKLQNNFDVYEIRPDLVVNNNNYDLGRLVSKTRTTTLGNHKIVWIATVTKTGVRTNIQIDNETIALNGVMSMNTADGERKIDLDIIDDWDQVKLYEFEESEIIGISLIPRQCTGLMCSVSAQLIYDVRTKTTTFFGSYRNDSEVRLFRYGQDDTPYFVSKNFNGDPHGVTRPQTITYELYKLESDGHFKIQTDSAGKNFFIKHTIFPHMEIDGDSVKPRKTVPKDTLEQNWIRKIE